MSIHKIIFYFVCSVKVNMGIGYTAGVVVLTAIGVTFLPKLLTPTVPVQVTVETAPGWEKLGDAFK